MVGGFQHAEYWIPAEQLDEFNQNILGKIEVVAEFRPEKIRIGMIPAESVRTLIGQLRDVFERTRSIEATIVVLWQAPHGL